jgi:mitotic spindle assembly checkpoint protein MAD1
LCENELQSAKARNGSLETMNEKLELLLEQRALRGDYNPQETKVLHFRMNPLAQMEVSKTDEIKLLKEANDKLRERVKILQSRESTSLNVTSVVEENLHLESNKQICGMFFSKFFFESVTKILGQTDLQSKLKSQELKSQRLIEAFKKTSQKFRQALYLLLGFKMDSLADSNFRLTSTYAENDDDNLMFKVETFVIFKKV